MAVIACLLIGNETWELQERSLRSIRALHPEQSIVLYYSLDGDRDAIIEILRELKIEIVDIGKPGLMKIMSASTYSQYNSLEFNIKTSFKWLAILGAMSSKLDDVIFIDADIALISALPFSSFNEIWKYYDIFVQDEGNQLFPKHPCTGFIGFKCCEDNITLLETLHKEQCSAIVSGESQHDQTTFYQQILRDFECYKKVYFMPQMLFPVGYMAPIYRRFQQVDDLKLGGHDDPFIFHANWVVGIEAKSALMDAMLAPKPLGDTGENNLSSD